MNESKRSPTSTNLPAPHPNVPVSLALVPSLGLGASGNLDVGVANGPSVQLRMEAVVIPPLVISTPVLVDAEKFSKVPDT